MKPTAKVLLGALVLVSIGWLIGFGHGRSAGSWFQIYCQAPSGSSAGAQAEQALSALGLKAVPFLVNEALSTREDTEFWKEFYGFLSELKRFHPRKFIGYDQKRANAKHLLREMNPPVPNIISAMKKELSEAGTTNHFRALSILSNARNGDEAAVPYFIRALHDPLSITKGLALAWFAEEHGGKEAAIPDLLEILRDIRQASTGPESICPRVEAAFALGSLHSNSVVAVPILKSYLQSDTNIYDQCSYALALCEIEPCQPDGFAFLLSCLTNTDSRYTRLGAWRLGILGRTASNAVPHLTAVLDHADFQTWKLVQKALRKVGATPEQIMPALTSKLHSSDDEFRVDAAERMLTVAPSHIEAQEVLMAEIRMHSERELGAIQSLGRAGTNAWRTLPELERALDSTNAYVGSAATTALMAIGARPETFLPKLKARLRPASLSIWYQRTGSQQAVDSWVIDFSKKILKLDPTDMDAQHALQALIRKDVASCPGAIRTLMLARPISQDTKDVLQLAVKSRNLITRETAENILKRLAKNLDPIDQEEEKKLREAIRQLAHVLEGE